MKSTSTAVVVCLMLSAGQAALAGTNDILIGLDEKIAYGPDGLVNGPPGKEAVLVMDVSNPAKPRIRASLPLMNSLLGPLRRRNDTPLADPVSDLYWTVMETLTAFVRERARWKEPKPAAEEETQPKPAPVFSR